MTFRGYFPKFPMFGYQRRKKSTKNTHSSPKITHFGGICLSRFLLKRHFWDSYLHTQIFSPYEWLLFELDLANPVKNVFSSDLLHLCPIKYGLGRLSQTTKSHGLIQPTSQKK